MADERRADHQYSVNRPPDAKRTVVIQQSRRPTQDRRTQGSPMSGHDGRRGTPTPPPLRVSPNQAGNQATISMLQRMKDIVVVPVHLPSGATGTSITGTVLPAGTVLPRPASRGSPSAGALILPPVVVVSGSNIVSVPVTSNAHAHIISTPANIPHRRSPNPPNAKVVSSKTDGSQRLSVTPPPGLSRSSPSTLPPRLLVPPGVNSGHNGASTQRVSQLPRVTVSAAEAQMFSQITPEQAHNLFQAMLPHADLAALSQSAHIVGRLPQLSSSAILQNQPTDLSLGPAQSQPQYPSMPASSVSASLPQDKSDLTQLHLTASIPQKAVPLQARLTTNSAPQRFFGSHIVTPISLQGEGHEGVPASLAQVLPVSLSHGSYAASQPVSHTSSTQCHLVASSAQCHLVAGGTHSHLVANIPAGPGIVPNGMDSLGATHHTQPLTGVHLPVSLLEPLGQVPDLTNCVTNHTSESETPMPELTPEKALTSEKSLLLRNGNTLSLTQEEQRERLVAPFNMRVKNLSNFPSTQTSYRANYRSHAYAIHRAKNFLNALQRARTGSITSAAKSLDLLRQNLQIHINREINVIIQRYMQFFRVGIENIKTNNGPTSVTDEHVATVCRQILEEAKKMYVSETSSTTLDVKNTTENAVSPNNSLRENRDVREKKINLFNIPKRRGSSDSEASIPRKRKKGRPPSFVHGVSGRSTPSKQGKSQEPVKREGPKWEPERLTPETKFVMGAKANKALGLGATRGRLYIKHPELFKYCGDQDDKQWLFEKQHMPATGGKAYMLVVEDIRDLALTDEYRDNPSLLMDNVTGFSVPQWMVEKMQVKMKEMKEAKPPRQKGRPPLSHTNNQDTTSALGDGEPPLPFTSLMTDTDKPSPCTTESLDLLVTDQDDIDPPDVSPYNMTVGFNHLSPAPSVSPAPSDLDALEDDVPTPFGTTD